MKRRALQWAIEELNSANLRDFQVISCGGAVYAN